MKKNLFFLLALVCTVSMFTACSDDDDKPIIPPADLTGTFGQDADTELTLKYGDVALTGKQVKFETADSKTATITLTDVIPGEAQTVISGVQLVPGDGEYTFSGTTGATNRSTAAAAAASIEYNGAVKKGALTLNLKVTMADANGWAKTYGLADFEKGEVTKISLALGEWKEKKATDFIVSPCYVSISLGDLEDLENIPKEDRSKASTIFQLSGMIRPALGAVLMQVLNTVSLESDGNIVANYSSGAVQFEPKWALMGNLTLTPEVIASLKEGKTWTNSPKNLAYWFEKGGKIYVKLNVPAIVAQAMADNGQGNAALAGTIEKVLDSNVADLKDLLSGLAKMPGMEMVGMLAQLSDETLGTVLDWVKNGVPLNVEEKDGHLRIYLDRAMLTPIIADLPNFVPVITEMNPMGMGKILSSMLTGVSAAWKYVTEFDLGLDLVTK